MEEIDPALDALSLFCNDVLFCRIRYPSADNRIGPLVAAIGIAVKITPATGKFRLKIKNQVQFAYCLRVSF
jgi:hypothetical protein